MSVRESHRTVVWVQEQEGTHWGHRHQLGWLQEGKIIIFDNKADFVNTCLLNKRLEIIAITKEIMFLSSADLDW